MEPALQKRVQRYGWDKAASYYENSWQQQLRPAHDALFDLACIQQGQKIIDIACGTGLMSFRAAEATGSKGFVFGTDISDKMVEIAGITAEENSIGNIGFERMDAELLQISDEEFDVAICALGLMYVPNPLNTMKEMHRVLKKGGQCIAAVWGKRTNCGWADIFEIVDKRVSSEVCPMFFNLGNDNVLENHFELAGFSTTKTIRIQSSLDYDTAEEACAASFEGGPVALAYFKFPENIKKEAREEYLASIEKYKTEKGYSVPAEFIICSGIK